MDLTFKGRCVILLIVMLAQVNSSQSTFGSYEKIIQKLRGYVIDSYDYCFDVPEKYLSAEYDFVVVGAGTSGSTVTSRLTEVPEWSVLLLEAGTEENIWTDMPLLAGTFQLTDYNWGYRTQPEKGACLAMKDQRCGWPRGKGMGGSSTINYMIYTRGHPRDYNEWQDLGNPGWGWEDVFPYFLKSEDAGDDLKNSPFHATGGYLSVQRVPYNTPLLDAFVEGGIQCGYKSIDYNSGELIGFSRLQVTERFGARCSASKAFLRPIRNRANLHVAKRAHVTKILIDPTTKRAFGVEFVKNGRTFRVKARKEVILSAGAINTPQLLMLSGVGPKEHLKAHNIRPIVDSPGVGRNLQDHVSMIGLNFVVNDTVAIVEDVVARPNAFIQYFLQSNGPLTIPGGTEALAYIRTNISDHPFDYPDIELFLASWAPSSDNGRIVKLSNQLRNDVYDRVYKPINSKDAFTIFPMLLKPISRGWIELKNKNPFSWPLIHANYFDHPRDLDILVEGIKFSIKLSKSEAFQRYNTSVHDIPLPGCAHLQFGTDEYWRCAARYMTTTIYHQCGTAKMGPDTDPEAVLDHQLRVRGVQGLRVVDASIMPTIPTAHTNAVCFMIGEKAADMIKESYYFQNIV